jgi:hypothetical protein
VAEEAGEEEEEGLEGLEDLAEAVAGAEEQAEVGSKIF